ncbi:MAG: UDP-N-acetylmuramoyl-tripeptide--D-alanyl-D-alanine ligase [Coriobacteriales bacterium]|jgi:UDP-N-acetylmuramoyl-tripeptide--D-alanyl-D-alanine ligase|nr:UDP-N-acetylmuramoyl-tripeptide--D-alanyl-D-alanine ligase [Coriobacteriales bacterium]
MRLSIAQITSFSQALTIVPARDAQRVVERVVWDTRALQAGALFIALPGEKADGNDFLCEAFAKGAAVAIASRRPTEAERHAAEQNRAALLYAPDGQLALQRLASAWREQLRARVVGITGSSGKTGTKALIAAVLERAFLTVSSLGNRNNEVGLPATVLAASASTEALVVEMAMRGLGQIEELCAIARPQVGVITNIGPVHLELLGSKEAVARAKAELISSLPDRSGIAILNGDDPYTPFIREIAQSAERELHVVLFGLGSHNDIRASAIDYDLDGRPSFELWLTDGRPHRLSLRLQGEHSVLNALAAAAVGISLGVAIPQIVDALAQAQPVPMRQVCHELADGSLLIDDCYNANPDSMGAALRLLEHLPASRVRIAALGGMGELGADEVALHESVGALVQQSGVDVLVTIGELALHYADGARAAGMDPERIISCENVEEAACALNDLRLRYAAGAPDAPAAPPDVAAPPDAPDAAPAPADAASSAPPSASSAPPSAPIILVKASRFMALEALVASVLATPIPSAEDEGGDAS